VGLIESTQRLGNRRGLTYVHSRRRPLLADLQRDPARREMPHLRWIRASGTGLLPRPRHHHHRARH